MRSTKQIAKWMTGVALAGALALVIPHEAQAQVSFGIGVNTYPAYGYAQPYAYSDYGRQRWFEHEQRERFEAEREAEFRREQWQREQYREHFEGRGWHDHDWHDHGWHGDRY